MRRLTKNLFLGAIGVTAVAGGGYYYFNMHYNNNNKNVETIKKLTANEFNALQNQQLLKEALQPGHLPWNYAEQKAKLLKKKNHNNNSNNNDNNDNSSVTTTMPYNKNDFDLFFYRLLGCPYCAKVQALLQFYHVPYTEVRIDPLSGSGLPDLRYDLAPQLGLQRRDLTSIINNNNNNNNKAATPSSEKDAERVYIVDSAYIMEKLAGPLRFADTLNMKNNNNNNKKKELQKTRNWITHHFQGATFALTNSTPMNAYYGFDYVAPEGQRQSMVYKVFGSAALYMLSTLKIKPKVQNLAPVSTTTTTTTTNNNNNNENDAGVNEAREVMIHYFEQQQQQQQQKDHNHNKDTKKNQKESKSAAAALHYPKDPKDWLRTELDVFLSLRPPTTTNNHNTAAKADFHGGDKPDLADIEMYGVTRVVAAHPVLGQVLRENTPFRAWEEKMEGYMQPL